MRSEGSGPEYRVRYANGDEVFYVSLVYNASIEAGVPCPDFDEVREIRWFAIHELGVAALNGLAIATFRDLGLLVDEH